MVRPGKIFRARSPLQTMFGGRYVEHCDTTAIPTCQVHRARLSWQNNLVRIQKRKQKTVHARASDAASDTRYSTRSFFDLIFLAQQKGYIVKYKESCMAILRHPLTQREEPVTISCAKQALEHFLTDEDKYYK